ncbi:hypothetical protein F5887DRAFT_116074 [Amanita rubescens]|nr:hypothetical protein F5887DRAFT_116074 [Amanita rubescens]
MDNRKGRSKLDCTVKLFLEFQSLSELVIMIDHESMFKVGIDKLYRKRPNLINDSGKIIGANLSLTHLELFQNEGTSPSSLTVLRLKVPEHLSISDSSPDITAIVAHARSLASIALCPNYRQILPVLHFNCIFPPIIQMAYVEDRMINYLRDTN